MFSSSGRVSYARATRWFMRSSLHLAALATLLSVAACTTVTVGTTHKIVADVSVKFFDESAPAVPTALDKQYTATCPQGQYVLAGGYNLAASDASSDWLVSDLPTPVQAVVDANHFYKPIPQLMRVVSSHPTPTLDGWTIQLAGMSYPDADRKIAVYATCAGGLRVRPTLANDVGECTGDELISGGGYMTGKYDYYILVDTPTQAEKPVKQSAYPAILESDANVNIPVTPSGYISAWDINGNDDGFNPAGYAKDNFVGVCVSRQDFSSEVRPQVATMTFNPTSWVATDVHGKTVYSSEQDGVTPCHPGAIMLPAEYAEYYIGDSNHHVDMRVDGVWEDITLDHWAASLSVGRAASFTGEEPQVVDIYVLCLTPA